ncbi:MAG TPA: DUF4139 domain-containing protein, partial [Kofleriaceae bacterium]|nr:DUF4139 domain-containing protein [Kofleriaceae bacterium]
PGPSGPLVGSVMFGLPHGPGDGAYGSGAEEEVDTKVDLARRSAPGSAAGAAPAAPGAPPPMAVQALRKSASAETSTLRTVVGGGRAKARDSAVYHDDALAAPRPSPDRGTGAGPSGRPGDALVAQLDFHGLMMAGFDHPQRGQLVAMSLAVRYQLSDPGKLSGADAGRLQHRLAAASQAAERVEQSEPPAGMSCDWSHDFDYALAAEGRIDVPSDGGWHSIPLCTRTTSARVRHVGVPREQPDVFRSATAHNPFEAPLLPGPVDVYDGSRFLVTAPLPMVAPGGELELPLGVDPSIKIARNTEYREEVTGMLRGGLRLIHDLRIDIHNHSATPIDLEIRERVPVPREHDSDEIQVKVTACKPPWQPWTPPLGSPHDQELRGGHAWRLEVAARGTANLTATYEIQIAAKHEVIGGNRRES